jgi:HPt (histidine-containing phosphotransfer) domain-containing protein
MIEPLAREEFMRFLDKQRADYARTLSLKLAEVDRLWSGIAARGAAPEDLALLTRAAHGLAGSGAMFGFADLSAAARALELRLQRLADGPGKPEGAVEATQEAVARLRSCAPRDT